MTQLLILGIRMDLGGTEKALLSFLAALDQTKFSVSLLLAENKGQLLKEIPGHVRLLPPIKNGALFTMSRANAASIFRSLSFPGKNTFLMRHRTLLSALIRRESGAGERFFIALMNEACSLFSEEYPGEKFDAALAFSGDRTMFYLCDKLCCHKKIAWLHFDYRHPKRDDIIYHSYFKRCQAVLSVSEACTALLSTTFPDLSDRFFTFYNLLPQHDILKKANESNSFPDPDFSGFRLLSVMRICRQKGVDLIPPILQNLKQKGLSLRWYLAGEGNIKERNALQKAAKRYGVENELVLLGPVSNPYPLMKRCDLFILPSRFEGLPITVEEAKLLAVPIVSTCYVSAFEQLQNGQLGAISRFSADSLSAVIYDLLIHEEKRQQFRNRLATCTVLTRDINWELQCLLAYC